MDTISSLSFPYREANGEYISLKKIYLTDDTDTTRYSIQLNDSAPRTCESISKIHTGSQEVLASQISYITNPEGSTPLLVQIPSTYNKIKFNVSILPKKDDNNSKHLIILKTTETLSLEQQKKLLLDNGYEETSTQISKLDYTQLPIDFDNTNEVQRIIINDSYDRQIFSNSQLDVSLWEYGGGEFTFLFKFILWVNDEKGEISAPTMPPIPATASPTTQTTKKQPYTFTIGQFRKAFVFNIEDGPEFRKSVHKYEADFPAFKKVATNFLEDLKGLEFLLKKLVTAKTKLIDNVGLLTEFQSHSLLNKLNFKKEFARSVNSIFDPFEHNLSFFLKEICDHKSLSKFSQLIQNASATHHTKDSSGDYNELSYHKKQFENNSKEYYNWLNKYLSNEKERPELKLLAKRKAFELSKFAYLNYLHLFLNNQYFNQILENFFKFTNLSFDESNQLLDYRQFNDNKTSHNLLGEDFQIYLNVLSRFNSERFQFRQMIEACQSNTELTNLIKHNRLNDLDNTDKASDDSHNIVTKDNFDLVFSGQGYSVTAEQVPRSYVYSQDQNSEMAGILYTLGGQGKQGWHKEWVVLNRGRLMEFSDWRHGQQPINKPIDIALSSIKATKFDKRQYCFEILTSKGNKHVFQAISEDERNKWIKALYNAGQLTDRLISPPSTGNGHKAPIALSNKKGLSKLITDFGEESLTGPKIVGNALNKSVSPVSIVSNQLKEKDHLQMVRMIPMSDNHICADCGSLDGVEWVSINFLTCFCINCSSCHRNLGTQISKIKSLKLDHFDEETSILLQYVNNRKVDEYLEFDLEKSHKITATSSHEDRLRFIKNKYVNKKYCQKFSNVHDLLIESIQKINIENTLKYIICGANINMHIQINISTPTEGSTEQSSLSRVFKKISLLEYSLRKYVEVQEQDKLNKYFIISELLLLNGCKIDNIERLNTEIGLTEEAVQYFEMKNLRLTGKSP